MDDLDRTLTQLENHDWGPPTYDSHLVTECHHLRYVPLRSLEPSDLRLLIGQGIGIMHLVPIAIDVLDLDPWTDCDLYPGCLLKAIAELPASYWEEHPRMILRFQSVLQEIETRQRFYADEVLPHWHRAFGGR